MTQSTLGTTGPADEPQAGPVAKTLPPLARGVLEQVAIDHGVCIRPVPMRRVDLHTGASDVVYLPCGHTLASVCLPCAERKRRLRAVQCAQGWHLDHEPVIQRADPDAEQAGLMELRARAQAERDRAAATGTAAGEGVEFWDRLLAELDGEIERSGVRGSLKTGDRPARRTRSTRRRQDAPDLPRRPIDARTLGRTYRGRDGKTFRPSLFLTLTLDSYGRVNSDGTPADPDTYDYTRAARDALHFGKLIDRFVQNLRRFVGYDVQYFATVEPQRRLATKCGGHPPTACSTRRTGSPFWTLRRAKAAATSTPTPARCCPPGMKPWTRSGRTRTLSRCTWCGSGASSTHRASWPTRPDHAS
ncbi:hypothetical protein Acsp03_39440 [Actinomadura sp. NBRC 104412]|nr:hypothetical protein Acsp03_39440 [Actinomadura sp. NBRC 104412]